MPKIKPIKRKAISKDKTELPPSKKHLAAVDADVLSSDEEFIDDDAFMKTPTIENRQDILSIKMQFKASLNNFKKILSADPNNWVNHMMLFENSFEEFLDNSIKTPPAVPPETITMDDVKSLIELSVTSKLDSIIKAIPFITSPNTNTNLKSYSSITSQGLLANPNTTNTTIIPANTSSTSPSVSPTKKASQNSFFVQIHDARTDPLSGKQILELVRTLIDPIALNIKIKNFFINKQDKVLFYLESLKDQTSLFDKLNSLQHEVLKLLLITQKQDQKSKIIITNVDNSISFETISNKMLDHEYIKPFLKPGDNITLIRRTKGNGLHSSIICEIPKELKEKFISI